MVPNLRKLDFDPLRDLLAVARIGESLRALAVSPKLPVKTLAEFIAYAKQNPGKLNYGSSGQGSTVHILTESFRHAAGIDIVHIPYRGAGPSLGGLQPHCSLPRNCRRIFSISIPATSRACSRTKAFTRRIVATGSRPAFLAPASFAELVREDHAYFGNLIRELKIKTSD
jgi:Tripartite tricarboxylate transporter family receptor